jgi:hypothetical protein
MNSSPGRKLRQDLQRSESSHFSKTKRRRILHRRLNGLARLLHDDDDKTRFDRCCSRRRADFGKYYCFPTVSRPLEYQSKVTVGQGSNAILRIQRCISRVKEGYPSAPHSKNFGEIEPPAATVAASPGVVGLGDDGALDTGEDTDAAVVTKVGEGKSAGVGSNSTPVVKGVDAEGIPDNVVGFELEECSVAVPKAVVAPAAEGDVAVDVVTAECGLEVERDLIGAGGVAENEVALDVEHHEVADVGLAVLALAGEMVSEGVVCCDEAVLERAAEIEALVAVKAKLAEGEGGAVGGMLEMLGGVVLKLHFNEGLQMRLANGQVLERRVELPEDAGLKANGVVEIERLLGDARGLGGWDVETGSTPLLLTKPLIPQNGI